MVYQQADSYLKTCMKTWMFCEACAHSEKDSAYPRQLLIDKCRACAHSCFTVVCRLINDAELIQESVLVCLLNCRECFEECEKYNYDADIRQCGETCWFCADMLKDLLLLSPNLN
jgi:hypothetical protein